MLLAGPGRYESKILMMDSEVDTKSKPMDDAKSSRKRERHEV